MTEQSSLHEASALPSSLKATHHTVDVWASIVHEHRQSSPSIERSNSRTVSSYEHDASTSSHGCHTTHLTSCVCECITAATSYCSSSTSQTKTLLSL
eukprot:CAMPEP_0181195740 /NCGR_PEP_ID=MMETSP1096-20121128/15058_1 /TAXON_ID=156174 ORGANISM="Chrysochromulina ericina, Strain CCMP281" /NCGR_SAMPLE_ID=MMETSP1096 /ASSEMBLY_ACC=CAM_ASM_000453 /LENGTH=96 /DNA_ID=CAMNT_0023285383 /DNA_START=724 /DNA_END=1011 /DNA_ORIENTATION=-